MPKTQNGNPDFKRRVTVFFDKDAYDKLRKEAQHDGRSVPKQIEQIIRHHLQLAA